MLRAPTRAAYVFHARLGLNPVFSYFPTAPSVLAAFSAFFGPWNKDSSIPTESLPFHVSHNSSYGKLCKQDVTP